MQRQQPTHEAFSLVETAIVLAIVGVVIGGIWVAASAVRQNMLGNQIVSGLVRAHDILKPLVTRRVIDANPSAMEQYTRVFLAGKLDGFSGNALDIWGGDYAIGTPLGAGSYLHLDMVSSPAIWPNFDPYSLVLGPVPAYMCRRLLARFRAIIQQDPAGEIFAGIWTSRASDGSWLGAYLPTAYSTLTGPRFDSEDTMCPGGDIKLDVFFAPLAN